MSTKILLVDDSLETMESLKTELHKRSEFEVVGMETNADEALKKIDSLKPDVVICDVILKGTDGFSMMEKMQKNGSESKVIVLSCLSQDSFILKAMSLGASYYMIKPCNVDALCERINDVLFGSSEVRQNNDFDKKQMKLLEEKITNIFITVGIPAHIKGYQFLREAIKMAIDNPDIINSITKKLYPAIANKFETSASKVERAIRHAIEVAWNRGKIENINTLFGVKVYSNNEKPTNGEFIALVADKMLLEGI